MQYNEQITALVGKAFSHGTRERYKTSLEHTRSFFKWKYNVDDMSNQKLDYAFVTEYECWLTCVRNCNHNMATKYIANFRKIVNQFIRDVWLAKDLFVGCKMTNREVERVALKENALQTIINKELPTEKMDLVRGKNKAFNP